MPIKPEIFISYAWGDKTDGGRKRDEIVDKLYNTLTAEGFTVIRDKTHVNYGDQFSDFTKRMSEGKFIVVVVSDKYLTSENCMSELLAIYRRSNSDIKELNKKIYPVVLADANILDPIHWGEKGKIWEQKTEELRKQTEGLNPANTAVLSKRIKLYTEIAAIVMEFSELLRDTNTLNPQRLSENNFGEIKNAIKERATGSQDAQHDLSKGVILHNIPRKMQLNNENLIKNNNVNNEDAKIDQTNIGSTVHNHYYEKDFKTKEAKAKKGRTKERVGLIIFVIAVLFSGVWIYFENTSNRRQPAHTDTASQAALTDTNRIKKDTTPHQNVGLPDTQIVTNIKPSEPKKPISEQKKINEYETLIEKGNNLKKMIENRSKNVESIYNSWKTEACGKLEQGNRAEFDSFQKIHGYFPNITTIDKMLELLINEKKQKNEN